MRLFRVKLRAFTGWAMAERIWNLAKAFFFSILFVGLQVWFLPRWMGFRGSWTAAIGEPWRWIGAPLLAFGAAGMIYCTWNFGFFGLGTPMPLDPPKNLVVVGLYRYVRNPMYTSMA